MKFAQVLLALTANIKGLAMDALEARTKNSRALTKRALHEGVERVPPSQTDLCCIHLGQLATLHTCNVRLGFRVIEPT
eukprot:CAMPEP_0180682940 /NCGR_PEP_ID=MMETSP1037_2-20121125/70842_1 /TAXON_ID=632150 /ORGANISM="Azadinium spinosum, Strain 3D9" /LENGTH=77 /DNA_ID=CAMNT_0022713001 /DNA_START=213 /DNA_END=442 /DNA_ORIENTATION=+